MNKILSQEEIKALFSAISSGNSDRAASPGKSPATDTAPYLEFQPSDFISQDQMRLMYLLYEYFSRYFATSLSEYLRNPVNIYLVSLKQVTYSDFIKTLPYPKLFASIGMRPLDGTITLELSLSLAFSMVNMVLGNPVQAISKNRDLTEFDLDTLDGVLRIAVQELKNAWNPMTDLEFFLREKGTRTQILPDVSSGEHVITAHLLMNVGHIPGMMYLCVSSRIVNRLWSRLDSENVWSVK